MHSEPSKPLRRPGDFHAVAKDIRDNQYAAIAIEPALAELLAEAFDNQDALLNPEVAEVLESLGKKDPYMSRDDFFLEAHDIVYQDSRLGRLADLAKSLDTIDPIFRSFAYMQNIATNTLLALGMSADVLASRAGDATYSSKTRYVTYPPIEAARPRFAIHSDTHTLTVIAANAKGLKIQGNHGWEFAPPNALIVFAARDIGYAEGLRGQYIHPANHRVTMTPGEERKSLVLFNCGAGDRYPRELIFPTKSAALSPL